MKKLKNVYAVFLNSKYGLGMQPTKGNTAKHARERFKKRFPKKSVMSISLLKPDSDNYYFFTTQAI